eukprot:CAMPEP_0201488726 /NCGR_PEP_ID=MMETSP0151_2-20130828/19342_1 /ASSEMBLY_ACC=CAM_ASM_000257 /TAXON_ID=200890 /ORGANISM="Paramoeba atlantica, Strain 621/1 / CCAP 1560/9" /LENGTH=279 /DNA_ID=CAMNT_0047874079 /DNA_START=123 /DNA_END=962 /DNA_ORIENTATION=-
MALKDLGSGAVLQCLEALTLGMPFEVWKTRMGRYREESTVRAFSNVYRAGGGGMSGVMSFWAGLGPKMIESASKGAVLLMSKEAINRGCLNVGLNKNISAFISGGGGGICQTIVMSPCTFLVTAVVNHPGYTITRCVREVYSKKGVRGFYHGASAVAIRQMTNWASRAGFTEFIRNKVKMHKFGTTDAKLSVFEESLCGIGGGALACWNHPIEVCRIEMQSRTVAGEPKLSLGGTIAHVVKTNGPLGLFKGVVPRIGLGIWQTLFMVSFANIIKERFLQ